MNLSQQSKLESLAEAIVNVCVGLCITMFFLPIVNKICGIQMNVGQMTLSTVLFTIISVLRSYIIRRFFSNLYTVKQFVKTQLIKIWKL